MVKWADEHSKFLRPSRDQLLEMDEDLVALGIPFDQPKFFEKVLIDLRSNEKDAAARAMRLLKRYVPDGPKLDTADAWATWWKESQHFLFASDAGDYRWYIDPLAKKRGVPTSELRGSRRADER